jgi:hypothetical protein
MTIAPCRGTVCRTAQNRVAGPVQTELVQLWHRRTGWMHHRDNWVFNNVQLVTLESRKRAHMCWLLVVFYYLLCGKNVI